MHDFDGNIKHYANEIARTHEKISELLLPFRRDFVQPSYEDLYVISELLMNAEACSSLLATELRAQDEPPKKPWYKTIFRK